MSMKILTLSFGFARNVPVWVHISQHRRHTIKHVLKSLAVSVVSNFVSYGHAEPSVVYVPYLQLNDVIYELEFEFNIILINGKYFWDPLPGLSNILLFLSNFARNITIWVHVKKKYIFP